MRKLKENFRRHKILYNVIPCLILFLALLYYFPIYGGVFVSGNTLTDIGEKMYRVLDPFLVMPYVLAALTLMVFMFYDRLWAKVLVLPMYIISILFSSVMIMGMTKIQDYIVFLPHMVCFILCVCIECIRWREKKTTG